MSLGEELARIDTLFIDTAPIIYFIEAHTVYGPLVKTVFESLDAGTIGGYTSVISLVEVLPKPVEAGHYKLADKFREFLAHGKNMSMIEVSTEIADRAGVLRGKYPFLKTMDAIQIAAAIAVNADAFLTNDKRIGKVKEIKFMILEDYAMK